MTLRPLAIVVVAAASLAPCPAAAAPPLSRGRFGPIALEMSWKAAWKALMAAGAKAMPSRMDVTKAMRAAPRGAKLVPFAGASYLCRRGIRRAYFRRPRHRGATGPRPRVHHTSTPMIHCASSLGFVRMRFGGGGDKLQRLSFSSRLFARRAPVRALLAQVRKVLGPPKRVKREKTFTHTIWRVAGGRRVTFGAIDSSAYHGKPAFRAILFITPR